MKYVLLVCIILLIPVLVYEIRKFINERTNILEMIVLPVIIIAGLAVFFGWG